MERSHLLGRRINQARRDRARAGPAQLEKARRAVEAAETERLSARDDEVAALRKWCESLGKRPYVIRPADGPGADQLEEFRKPQRAAQRKVIPGAPR